MTKSVLGTGIIAESSISPFKPVPSRSVSSFLAFSLQFQPNNLTCCVSL
ncbi:MAG: hypothetical protein ACFFAQ_11240 [Promethearchaeota archaeon]